MKKISFNLFESYEEFEERYQNLLLVRDFNETIIIKDNLGYLNLCQIVVYYDDTNGITNYSIEVNGHNTLKTNRLESLLNCIKESFFM